VTDLGLGRLEETACKDSCPTSTRTRVRKELVCSAADLSGAQHPPVGERLRARRRRFACRTGVGSTARRGHQENRARARRPVSQSRPTRCTGSRPARGRRDRVGVLDRSTDEHDVFNRSADPALSTSVGFPAGEGKRGPRTGRAARATRSADRAHPASGGAISSSASMPATQSSRRAFTLPKRPGSRAPRRHRSCGRRARLLLAPVDAEQACDTPLRRRSPSASAHQLRVAGALDDEVEAAEVAAPRGRRIRRRFSSMSGFPARAPSSPTSTPSRR